MYDNDELYKIYKKAFENVYDAYCKMLRELDYTKISHYKTKLTDTEMTYCANDVKYMHFSMLT